MKLITILLYLWMSSSLAFSSWIDESTIPPPFAGFTGVHTAANRNVPLSKLAGGKVRLNFKVHKYAYQDPIVFPGVARAGHLHMYFGNSCIDGFSNLSSLMDCPSSTMIGGTANKSAYWMPAITDYRTGAIQQPYQTLFYYTTDKVSAPLVQAHP